MLATGIVDTVVAVDRLFVELMAPSDVARFVVSLVLSAYFQQIRFWGMGGRSLNVVC